jgi:hypothetical protein
MSFMPEMEFCTASRPLSEAASERMATWADSSAPRDTWVSVSATLNTCCVVS